MTPKEKHPEPSTSRCPEMDPYFRRCVLDADHDGPHRTAKISA